MNNLRGNKFSLITGVVVGALYGIASQFLLKAESLKAVFGIMTIGFIFILPFCLGVITVYFANDRSRASWSFRILMPLGTSSLCLLLALITGMEGTICLIMTIPIYLPMSVLGGILAGIFLSEIHSNRMNSFAFGAIIIMPFLVSGIEERYPLPEEIRQVNTSILIESSPLVVWSQITSIPKITESQESFFYFMGFPRPVEATLSNEGVGGIREAKFEKGLMFLETITEWVPEKKINFQIKADPANTPLTTLDTHVTVGGRYFDALLGEYEIEKISNKQIRLHLFSRYRLSTRFNFYAEIWSDFLMRDIQENILRVIKTRSEKINLQ